MFTRIGWIAVLLVLMASSVAYAQNGKLRGRITDEDNEPVMLANLKLISSQGSEVGSGNTDTDGNYSFSNLPPGSYTMVVYYAGNEFTVKGINVRSNKTEELNFPISSEIKLGDVDIVADQFKGAVDIDILSQTADFDAGDILNNAGGRGVGAALQQVAGVFTVDNSGAVNFRGGRSENTQVFVDGERVIGSQALSLAAIGQISVILGGTPAEYGDVTGGVISIATAAPSAQTSVTAEIVSSQFTDPYNYNLGALSLSGPLFFQRDSAGNRTNNVRMGYFLAGEYQSELDRSPSAIPLFKLKDGVLDDLKANPVVLDAQGQTFVNRANFLRNDQIEQTPLKVGNGGDQMRFNGRLDFTLAPGTFLKLGGAVDRGRFDIWDQRRAFLAPDGMEQRNQNTYRGYIRFQQTFASSDQSALMKSFSYQLQASYTSFEQIRSHGPFGDNVFHYGHVGLFDQNLAETFEIITPDDPRHNRNLTSSAYWQTAGFSDTLFVMNPDPSTSANPVLHRYNQVIYDYANQNSRPFFLPPVDFRFRNGIFNNLDLLNLGGIINGFARAELNGSLNVYSLFDGQGTVWPAYTRRNDELIRFSGQANIALGKGTDNKNVHNIKLGFEFDQRYERFFSVNPGGLWNIMRQLANKHLTNLDTSNAQPVFVDGVFQDTVRLLPQYVESEQSTFDRNVRVKLGLPVNGSTFINPDAYGPDFYSLDMFSANELLNNGNSLVTYYGYDYTGKRVSRGSAESFFSDLQNRPQNAFAPTYISGYVQDKFEWDRIIFQLGVRVDRLDLNQQVLRDKFVLAPTYSAAEAAQRLGYELPSIIGQDWVPYGDNTLNPTRILGYRDGDRWYDAQGNAVNPRLLEVNGRVNPFLIQDSLTIDAFEDYTPQINVMPRVAFSFPINPNATFFAHYDVLTQRPTAAQVGLFTDYLFLQQNATSSIANPALRPTRTIDYEVGFKQGLAPNKYGLPQIGITLSAYYREMRDMVQIVRNQNAYPITYDSFENVDFGTVRGFMIEFSTMRMGIVELRASYALQFATGTGSSFSSSRNALNGVEGFSLIRNELPLDFDQRHTIAGSFDIRWESMYGKNGPKIGKIYPFKDFGINISYNLGSGTPFSYNAIPNPADVQFGVNSNIQTAGTPNSNNLPFRSIINLRADKTFTIVLNKKKLPDANDGPNVIDLSAKTVKPRYMGLNVYILCTNLFDSQNVYGVYRYSGLPDDSGFLTSGVAETFIQQQIDPESFRQLYRIREQNPFNFGFPRRLRIGLMLNF